jgi:RNA polymerase sigma-70 factor (ECF subfamily)
MDKEQDIISKVISGDTAAFRQLVERHQKVAFQFAMNLLQNQADAEDATQEAFVSAFENLPRFDASRAQFATWLLTMVRNRCLNQLKRRNEEPIHRVEPIDHRQGSDQVVEREIWSDLSRALGQLPVEQRTAFVLAEMQELPYAEIAMIEGVELGTVKSRVSRARERLRQILVAWQPSKAGGNP